MPARDGRMHRLARAVPDGRTAILGSLSWSLAMAASAALSVAASGWLPGPNPVAVILLFFAGGLAAFIPAAFVVRLLAGQRAEARFAAWFVALALFTIALTGTLYAVHFRLTIAEAHSPLFSRGWFFETGFTLAAAFYQFLVLGMPRFYPAGFLMLAAIATWLARRAR
jgi:hypothetical protein